MIEPAHRWGRARTTGSALVLLGVATVLLLALVPPVAAVAAQGGLCERFAATPSDGGGYTVQNNR